MKSKKLFAILTLVAFMMTLLPTLAFAAVGTLERNYSPDKTTVTVTNNNIDEFYNVGTPDTMAVLTLTFKNSSGTKVAAGTKVDFAMKTSSDLFDGHMANAAGQIGDTVGAYVANTEFVDAYKYAISSKDGAFFDDVTTDANSQVKFYIGSTHAVSFDVGFFAGDDADASEIATKKINVEKEEGSITLNAYTDDDDSNWDAGHAVTVAGYEAGQGFDLVAELSSDDEDVPVTFQQKEEDGTWVTLGTADSNEDGIADFWVDADNAATYFFKAKTSDEKSDELQIKIIASDPDHLVAKTTDGKKIAVDEEGNVQFYLYDEFGNKIKSDLGGPVEFEVTSAPTDSDLTDDDATAVDTDGKGVAKFEFTPDEIGKYTIRAEVLASNKKATIQVEAVEMGTIKSFTYELDNKDGDEVTTLRVSKKSETETTNEVAADVSGTLVVNGVGENGAELELDTDDLTYTSSAPADVDVTDGDINLDAGASGTYQITVYYAEDNVLGTYDLKVVGGVNALKVTPTVNGKTATVDMQYIDKNGDPTYTTKFAGGVADENFTVSAADGLTVTDTSKIDTTGAGSFKITAAEYGTYKVTVMTSTKHITKTFDVTFGQPAAEKPGAKTINMFIGSKGFTVDSAAATCDVAPFIKDGRTMVEVRAVAKAFGVADADIAYANGVVTLKGADGTTVTITVGKTDITTSAGKTITSDVAAYITPEGRTVLPIRFIGEAFGYAAAYDAATQAVTFTLQ